MHDNLTQLHDLLGACERILRTPIPVAYTRHTTRCLIIWLTVMPYALWGNLGWATLVVAPLISFLLAGINEIGIDVEEPFSLLPLEAISDRAKTDCQEIVSMQVRPVTRLHSQLGHFRPRCSCGRPLAASPADVKLYCILQTFRLGVIDVLTLLLAVERYTCMLTRPGSLCLRPRGSMVLCCCAMNRGP